MLLYKNVPYRTRPEISKQYKCIVFYLRLGTYWSHTRKHHPAKGKDMNYCPLVLSKAKYFSLNTFCGTSTGTDILLTGVTLNAVYNPMRNTSPRLGTCFDNQMT